MQLGRHPPDGGLEELGGRLLLADARECRQGRIPMTDHGRLEPIVIGEVPRPAARLLPKQADRLENPPCLPKLTSSQAFLRALRTVARGFIGFAPVASILDVPDPGEPEPLHLYYHDCTRIFGEVR